MAVSPLILAALGGGALLLLGKSKGPANSSAKTTAPKPSGKAPTHKVTGGSGLKWIVRQVKIVNGKIFMDIFTTNGDRILRYKQTGSNRNTRVFVAAPTTAEKGLVTTAMKDFGIKKS